MELRALETALEHYRRGSRLWRRKVEILDFLGSLRRDQHRFDEAHVCLDRALAIYRTYQEPELVAKVLISKTTLYKHTVKLEFVTDCTTAAIQVEFVPLADIVGVCVAEIEAIQTNHYRLKNHPLFSTKILIQINSLENWGDIFFDGFESGDLTAWSSTMP